MLINNVTHQRETLTEWPIRPPLTITTHGGLNTCNGTLVTHNSNTVDNKNDRLIT